MKKYVWAMLFCFLTMFIIKLINWYSPIYIPDFMAGWLIGSAYWCTVLYYANKKNKKSGEVLDYYDFIKR